MIITENQTSAMHSLTNQFSREMLFDELQNIVIFMTIFQENKGERQDIRRLE